MVGRGPEVGNVTANVLRNIWAHTVIFCGHFPGDVQTFTEDQIEGETRGQWYVRQIQGSANIDGGLLYFPRKERAGSVKAHVAGFGETIEIERSIGATPSLLTAD